MNQQVATTGVGDVLSSVVIHGDLSKLSDSQKVSYYMELCRSLGLNPVTQPFALLKFQGKEVLYAKKDATEQLRKIHGISIMELSGELQHDNTYVVTCKVKDKYGKTDMATGVVSVEGLKLENLANAKMKCECVPLESEILTKNGWKKYDEIFEGEQVLAYDCASDACEWTPLQKISVFDKAVTISFGTELHHFRCTPNHSWAVKKPKYIQPAKSGPRGKYKNRILDGFLCESTEIKTTYGVVLAARAPGGTSILSPNEAALLGWIFTDGTIQRRGNHLRLGISQSKPEGKSAILALLQSINDQYYIVESKPTVRTFPSGNTYACLPQSWYYLKADYSRYLFDKAGISCSKDLPALCCNLSEAARKSMLEAMMMGDGDARGVFGKKRKPGVMDAFQILATLEGYALGKMGLSSVGEVPVQKIRKQRSMAGINIKLTDPEYMPVWCPTTALGTWVMRQNGNVTITGNTKAKRRATLSICGLGMMDESEAQTVDANAVTVDIPIPKKQELTDKAFGGAMERIQKGERDLIQKLRDSCQLTQAQSDTLLAVEDANHVAA